MECKSPDFRLGEQLVQARSFFGGLDAKLVVIRVGIVNDFEGLTMQGTVASDRRRNKAAYVRIEVARR